MPDRVIRDELLESERWLGLKDNADRLAYLALLLKADCLGNFDAGEYRLLRLWRDFGIGTTQLVAKTLTELVDVDLVRLYEHEGKHFLHIPRFGQNQYYLHPKYPQSPWTTDKQKQALTRKRTSIETVPPHNRTGAITSDALSEVKRSEVDINTPSGRPDALAVLEFLNETTGHAYRPVETTINKIRARLREGATVDECKAVILAKHAEWGSDPKMKKHLSPDTLFGPEKFAKYIGQLGNQAARQPWD